MKKKRTYINCFGQKVVVTINPELDKYNDVIISPWKMEQLKEVIKTAGDPTEIFEKMEEEEAAKKMQSKK